MLSEGLLKTKDIQQRINEIEENESFQRLIEIRKKITNLQSSNFTDQDYQVHVNQQTEVLDKSFHNEILATHNLVTMGYMVLKAKKEKELREEQSPFEDEQKVFSWNTLLTVWKFYQSPEVKYLRRGLLAARLIATFGSDISAYAEIAFEAAMEQLLESAIAEEALQEEELLKEVDEEQEQQQEKDEEQKDEEQEQQQEGKQQEGEQQEGEQQDVVEEEDINEEVQEEVEEEGDNWELWNLFFSGMDLLQYLTAAALKALDINWLAMAMGAGLFIMGTYLLISRIRKGEKVGILPFALMLAGVLIGVLAYFAISIPLIAGIFFALYGIAKMAYSLLWKKEELNLKFLLKNITNILTLIIGITLIISSLMTLQFIVLATIGVALFVTLFRLSVALYFKYEEKKAEKTERAKTEAETAEVAAAEARTKVKIAEVAAKENREKQAITEAQGYLQDLFRLAQEKIEKEETERIIDELKIAMQQEKEFCDQEVTDFAKTLYMENAENIVMLKQFLPQEDKSEEGEREGESEGEGSALLFVTKTLETILEESKKSFPEVSESDELIDQDQLSSEINKLETSIALVDDVIKANNVDHPAHSDTQNLQDRLATLKENLQGHKTKLQEKVEYWYQKPYFGFFTPSAKEGVGTAGLAFGYGG